MRATWIAGAALGLVALSSPAAAQAGQRAPDFGALRWYNTPPLTMEGLTGKAVMVEVFRTW